jgi:hypothetical protein
VTARVTSSSLPWGFRAQLTREHDGDSFWMLCDTGFDGRHEPELRLAGVHAPEIHPVQPGAVDTLAFVNGWLVSVQANDPHRRWPFWVDVVMTSSFEPEMDESFTRFVATVWPFSNRATSLNEAVNTFLSGHPEWPSGD